MILQPLRRVTRDESEGCDRIQLSVLALIRRLTLAWWHAVAGHRALAVKSGESTSHMREKLEPRGSEVGAPHGTTADENKGRGATWTNERT